MKLSKLAFPIVFGVLAFGASQMASAAINVPLVLSATVHGFPDLFTDNVLAASASDNIRYAVNGAPIGGGRSGVIVEFDAVNPILRSVRPGRITIRTEARLRPTGNVNVFLYNWANDSYVGLGPMLFDGIDRTRTLAIGTNVRRFINEVGGIRVRLESRTAGRPHRFELDRLQVLVD
ncbi:MAG TPA: hypothetical protein PLL78_12135 [Fimbriimonadaceae bacterium]|nr:hypothetical protein [Fimbriimonadaceae bacterium]HRJ97424.1 hypothetical protein [Fimbriimonadaceae bacterium]